MIIKNPNDEQLSAWLGKHDGTGEYRCGDTYLSLGLPQASNCADYALYGAAESGIWWPSTWPDLSTNRLFAEREAKRHMDLHRSWR